MKAKRNNASQALSTMASVQLKLLFVSINIIISVSCSSLTFKSAGWKKVALLFFKTPY